MRPRLKRAPSLLLPTTASAVIHHTVAQAGCTLGRSVVLFATLPLPLPIPTGSLVRGEIPTAVHADLSVKAMISTAVLWPIQHQRAAISILDPSSVATSSKEVRVEAMIPAAISWPRLQRQAPLPLPLMASCYDISAVPCTRPQLQPPLSLPLTASSGKPSPTAFCVYLSEEAKTAATVH